MVIQMGNSNIEVQEIETAESIDEEKTHDEAEDVKRIAPWTRQITIRGVIASIVIGIMYSVIVMKLNLTTGLVPNLNVSAALIAYVFIKTWTTLLEKAGIVSTPFTRQENSVIQTCAVACYSIAVGGKFASQMFLPWKCFIILVGMSSICYSAFYETWALLINCSHLLSTDL